MANEKASSASSSGKPPASAPRKRKAPVSTAPRLQAKTLLASTRDELREIQTDLQELADARRLLLARDKRGTKSTLQLVPPKT
ncbi:hypothetical protein Poli38472_002995 [Pythium oligandrum]|uniref:Uncharacterized protein n=1 Tax=Pythium oligandrum TaxID=41045 RepID=A0A8K1C5Z7_PYTOL|nr:hypothetical protein Poli38472_002995 [Pythium oligandrum]|eukprot:TMW57070.1 hypothetical protein Poli38472_002995 [Pythium oligandrum]